MRGMEIGLLRLPASALVGCIVGSIAGAQKSIGLGLRDGGLGLAVGIACYIAAVPPYGKRFSNDTLIASLRGP